MAKKCWMPWNAAICFSIPLDDQRQWYRYHHLFADVLQTHLIEAQPEQVLTLHQRASDWYEQNDLRSDAIRHALARKGLRARGRPDRASMAGSRGGKYPVHCMARLGKVLPEALVHARPVLTLGYAYALLGRGELEAAEARLQDAERWLELTDTRSAAEPENAIR
jgi:LuxR family transcriptional regulator, maltose regulon positive regulatory protein